ncbi:MAG: PAS-domain containing protein, partial [Alphaproteobacteria bacterium]|nr:PAS-domain containing protein [Alphaproteobacteria bacterium]
MADGLAVLASDGSVLAANPAFTAALPGAIDSIVGRRLADALRETARTGRFIGYDAKNAEQFVAVWEGSLARPAGHLDLVERGGRWLRFYTIPGAGARRIIGFTDVSEFKRPRADLEAAQRLLDDALEGMSDAVVIWDADDRLMKCNSAYRALVRQNPKAMTPGVSLEQAVRTAITFAATSMGLVVGPQEEMLIGRLLDQHRKRGPPVEYTVGEKGWLHCQVSPTATGGVVTRF